MALDFDYDARIARLIGITEVDAVAVVPGANMTYFTGVHMHLSERPTIAIFSDTGRACILPELEVGVWASRPELKMQLFPWSDADGYAAAFVQAVDALRLDNASLGVDGQTMRVFEFMALHGAGARQIKDVGAALLDIRAIKSEKEVDAMRAAIKLSEQALYRVMSEVEPGMTERKIADRLNAVLREAGTQGFAFEALVQTGPNSAVPHGRVSDRVLQQGEFLLIDFGGMRYGYPADITRTFCLGEPTDEMQRIYDTVLAANRAAIAAIKPGVTASTIDRAARDVIAAAGYGEYFVHRTGHGLGLETHEQPQISSASQQVLEPGMVFTVEPGVYVPGLGGVRIEDNVYVTESGAEVLTTYERKLSPR